MAYFFWETPAGDLGTYTQGTYFEMPLKIFNPTNLTPTFKFLSGDLPGGMQVNSIGKLQGVPIVLNDLGVAQTQYYQFTIRATLGNQVNDRTFSMGVMNIQPPVISPTQHFLGSVFDGEFYEQQLSAVELDPNIKLSWTVSSGALPPGVTLDKSTGLLSGFVMPVLLNGEYGPNGFDGLESVGGVVTSRQDYDTPPYDFIGIPQTTNYKWTVEVSNGIDAAVQEYELNVVGKGDWSSDNNDALVNNTYLTVDGDNIYVPAILTPPQTLPVGRAGSHYGFKITATDFQGNNIQYNTYSIATGSFDANGDGVNHQFGVGFGTTPFDDVSSGTAAALPGLTIDPTNGWIYGNIIPQAETLTVFDFAIIASKVVGNLTYQGAPVYYKLPVAGEINNVVEWVTAPDLGQMDNGAISEITLIAKHLGGKPLRYYLVDKPRAKLPQGTKLLTSGDITGRASFEYFSLDGGNITFDKDLTHFDNIFRFSVRAETHDGSASAVQEFTLRVNNYNKTPYENLYLKALPSYSQRQIYRSVIDNTEIFIPESIYRPEDPWFGIQDDIKLLFMAGLSPSEMSEYQSVMVHNHFNKTLKFGDIKTAVSLDANYNIKYEVVYIEVLDPMENSAGKGPVQLINMTNKINPYLDRDGNGFTIAYPNSMQNMETSIKSLGFANQSALPDWMTSNQVDDVTTGKFLPPLGLINAVVLAYTKPGYSKLIAYRLRNSDINFNNITFTADRYQLDNTLSKNFNIGSTSFITTKETTLDSTVNFVGTLSATVDYAISDISFDSINGHSIDYIRAHGGIDGVINFFDGQTLVFAQQEGFGTNKIYDGWVSYQDGFIGDNLTTPSVEGFDSEEYDRYITIPGYTEKSQGMSTTNQRGGVWKINVIGEYILLSFVQEILPNQRVKVKSGKTYASSTLYYNPILADWQSVPAYTHVPVTGVLSIKPTTFDGGGTKFFSHRDNYYVPESSDKYLKFPQIGVFV